jgi:hypothetical protein
MHDVSCHRIGVRAQRAVRKSTRTPAKKEQQHV